MRRQRCAKIVATLGPASSTAEQIRALFAAGARFFFVATPDEGIAARTALPDAHIFVLDGLYPGAANLYIRQNLMPVISSKFLVISTAGAKLAHPRCVGTLMVVPA